MWSEHCGYKYSRPRNADELYERQVLPENLQVATLEAVLDGLNYEVLSGNIGVVMKMESHNHPSAVEPFQGAARRSRRHFLRDIFTMGARPIAGLNSLRFGPINGPENAHTRYLLEHVVGGISHYLWKLRS